MMKNDENLSELELKSFWFKSHKKAFVQWFACNAVEVSAKCKTQHKTKVNASELNSVGLSGSETARQRFPGLLKVGDVE